MEPEAATLIPPYTLVRSRRRRRSLEMSVEPIRGLVVRAPINAPQEQVERFVTDRTRWVRRALERQRVRERQLRREFSTGETLSYLGQALRLVVAGRRAGEAAEAELVGASLEVGIRAGLTESGERSAVAGAVERWYKTRAEVVCSERVRFFAPTIGVRPKRLKIRAQKTRWGSCGKDGSIYLNWALVVAPLHVLDYLVVHELCHLKQAGHGRRFWQLVAAVLPDYEARRAELRRDGWRYRLG